MLASTSVCLLAKILHSYGSTFCSGMWLGLDWLVIFLYRFTISSKLVVVVVELDVSRNKMNFNGNALMSCPHNKCVALKCKHIFNVSIYLQWILPFYSFVWNSNSIFIQRSSFSSSAINLAPLLQGWVGSNFIFTSWWASWWLTNIWYSCLNLCSDPSIAGKEVGFHSLISGTFYWMWQTNKESHFRVEVRGQSWW